MNSAANSASVRAGIEVLEEVDTEQIQSPEEVTGEMGKDGDAGNRGVDYYFRIFFLISFFLNKFKKSFLI